MKKTTKKLISIFLSLLMVLSLIPMGTMTAMAYENNDHCQCGHEFVNHPQGFPTMCVRCPDGNCTSGGFAPAGPATCGKCTACGHPWTKHGSDKCSQCFDDMSGDCYFEVSGSAGACVLDAGHTGACSATLPPCGLCAACGHPQGSHSQIDDWCNDCKFGDGGKCNGEILFEPCVLPEGHTEAHTAWTTITDTNEINTLLAKLVGLYNYKYNPENRNIAIYGDSTNGYNFNYYNKATLTEDELTLSVVKQKGDHYYIGFGKYGFTFIFDNEGKLSQIYQAWVKNDGTVNDYYDSTFVYAGTAVCGICTECGHKKVEHGEYCETCDMTSGPCNNESKYVACVLDKGHTGNHSDGTPEWVDTVVSKVDASADKLVNDKGETYAEVTSKNGGITGTIALLTNPVYTNEGSVYTIRGYLGASIINEGEVVITLDSNGDVASLAVNAYASGNQTNSLTYKKKAPVFGSSSSVVEEEKQEETTPAPVTEEVYVTKAIVPSKSKIKVTVNKVDGVDGYQIQYGRVKSFKKSKKTITTKKTVKTIKVKKPGKKYYVRVRSFKIVNGKKVYSNWSKIESIKTK